MRYVGCWDCRWRQRCSPDATTGAATLKSTLTADPADTSSPYTGLSGTSFGIDFNPVVDRLRIVSDSGQNLRVNVDNGAVTTDGGLNVGGTLRTGVVEAGYTNSFGATCRTTLFYVDATTDKLLTTSDPNNGVVTEVGALGVNASVASGFKISTASDGTNTATAAFGRCHRDDTDATVKCVPSVASGRCFDDNGPFLSDSGCACGARLRDRAPAALLRILLSSRCDSVACYTGETCAHSRRRCAGSGARCHRARGAGAGAAAHRCGSGARGRPGAGLDPFREEAGRT
jgi:hypothetical protein